MSGSTQALPAQRVTIRLDDLSRSRHTGNLEQAWSELPVPLETVR